MLLPGNSPCKSTAAPSFSEQFLQCKARRSLWLTFQGEHRELNWSFHCFSLKTAPVWDHISACYNLPKCWSLQQHFSGSPKDMGLYILKYKCRGIHTSLPRIWHTQRSWLHLSHSFGLSFAGGLQYLHVDVTVLCRWVVSVAGLDHHFLSLWKEAVLHPSHNFKWNEQLTSIFCKSMFWQHSGNSLEARRNQQIFWSAFHMICPPISSKTLLFWA